MYLKSSFGFPIPRKGQLSCDCTLLFGDGCWLSDPVCFQARADSIRWGAIYHNGGIFLEPDVFLGPWCFVSPKWSKLPKDAIGNAEFILLRIKIEMLMIWNADFLNALLNYLLHWEGGSKLESTNQANGRRYHAYSWEAGAFGLLWSNQIGHFFAWWPGLKKQRRFCHFVGWRLLIAV